MRPVFVLSAARTPIGKFGGSFASLTAADLGEVAAKAAIERSGLPAAAIDETIFGHARQAGGGPNTARQVSHRAGVPDSVPAYTVNKACASSLKALTLGALSIAAGENDAVLVGGTECMSATPYLLPRARFGYRMGNSEVVDAMYRDGFLCPLCGQLMGETAENLVREYGILRAEQDAFAAESQRRAAQAIASGRFAEEIAPVNVANRGGGLIPEGGQIPGILVEKDEHPRPDTTVESLAKLPPVFDPESGTVHAGNSSGITDGAAALVLASEEATRKSGVEPLARVVAWTSAGVDPARMGVGPVPALRALLERQKLKLDAVDLIELNEAFAAQVIACARELPLDLARVNVNGGAIALGHPIGATGARISTTLLHEMKKRRAKRGIATLCVSGGMGMAVLFERE
ncbi:MAG: acetyl-CoA C-acetyltransferase [Acidobacteriota bacterium]|nr:acetyl-CoA C-acetyltransferase [Acidobacteriota bacterium]MDQ5871983.1 acetyl-CoA C-acetyltransferase [Acidobacteriota bacterium]